MISFQNQTLLITGGTGSFGNAVLRRFLTTDIAEIRILSRDEKKQDDMRHTYQTIMPEYAEKIRFYIGDVRDYTSIVNAFRGVDYVFHAAALKQVPSCEFYPMEAVRTNVIGSDNVISACVANHVQKAIFLGAFCTNRSPCSPCSNAYSTRSTASCSVIIKRVMAGSVTVRGLPSSACSQNSGMTEPREAMTFPYRVRQRIGSPGSICRERAMTFFSMMALVMPMALIGYAARHAQKKRRKNSREAARHSRQPP